jgi:dTDP-4-amino-4,6-dideoxygalactose transaminase
MFPEMKRVTRELLRRGVDSKHLYMRDCSGLVEGGPSFENAARAEREVLHLPAYPELSEAQVDRVAERVEEVVELLAAGA